MVDDYTRRSWLVEINSKEDTLITFRDLKNRIEADKATYKVAVVRTDSGTEFSSDEWEKFRKEQGIEHEFSMPYRQ